jgi:hypothetical protein
MNSKPLLFRKILAVLVLMCVAMAADCGELSIAKAKSDSKAVATYANAGVEITRALFHAGKITLQQKDQIADGFITLAQGGGAFEGLVASIEREYGEKAPPKAEIDRLFSTFDREVVDKLVAVLQSVKVPGIDKSIGPTIELLKTAVLAVAGAFRKREQVVAKISGA